MTLLEILSALRRGHIELRPAGGALRFGPACSVPDALRAALAEQKPALLRVLHDRELVFRAPEDWPAPGEWVRTPAGAGELIGWSEAEALIQLFAVPGESEPIPRLIWARADQIIGELEASPKT